MAALASAQHADWQLPTPQGELPAERLGISKAFADLLSVRGLTSEQAARDFLNHHWHWQPHHWAWPELVRATDRLVEAINAKEPIAIYGDYDADGVTATAVLFSFLKGLNADVICHLPHRMHDGYGLSIPALDRLAELNRRLVVTVDNGVSAVAEIAHANAIGLEVIVTDHHTPPETLPEALAMVNPRCYDPELGVLAGCGVAWLLCASLQRALGQGDADSLLDIVALGSVADQVPLTGINRHLVHRGLSRLNETLRPGLKALLGRAGRDLGQPLTAQDIGFVIGPRLNAAGRLEHPQVAVDLLLAETPEEADELAGQLEQLNQRRRHLTDEMTAHAHALVNETCDLAVDRCLVLGSPSWHIGIAGIVAARLSETYQRPTIICCLDGETWKGSGRSPAGIDLHGLLKANAQWLMRFGGHKQAAGCTIAVDHLEPLRLGMNRTLRQTLSDLARQPVPVDGLLSLAEVGPGLIEELRALEPTGQANPLPRFGTTDVQVLEASLRGARGDTLIAELTDGQHAFRAVGMGAGHVMPLPERLDIVYTPEFNHFRGRTTLQLRLHAVGGVHAAVTPETAAPHRPAAAPFAIVDDRDTPDLAAAAETITERWPDAVVWAPSPAAHAWWQARLPHRHVVGPGESLPRTDHLLVAAYPEDLEALRQAIVETGAGDVHLLLGPLATNDQPALDPGLMNQAYRRLKELETVPVAELARQTWPFAAQLFPIVWQGLREAGLVVVRGERWHRLKPSGPIPVTELPALRRYEGRRQWWRALAEMPASDLAELLQEGDSGLC